MDVTPLIRSDAKIIQSYRGGAFKISNEQYDHPVVVVHDAVLAWAPADPVTLDDFKILDGLRGRVEVFLLGTGDKQKMLSPALRQQIKQAYGVSVDSMDNGAAARTYNVLMAEGRLVAVGLTK